MGADPPPSSMADPMQVRRQHYSDHDASTVPPSAIAHHRCRCRTDVGHTPHCHAPQSIQHLPENEPLHPMYAGLALAIAHYLAYDGNKLQVSTPKQQLHGMISPWHLT